MASIKNQHIYSNDRAKLERINQEFTEYLGRQTELKDGVLTIFALPRPKMRWCKGCEKDKPIKQFTKRVRWMKEVLCRRCERDRKSQSTIVEDASRP